MNNNFFDSLQRQLDEERRRRDIAYMSQPLRLDPYHTYNRMGQVFGIGATGMPLDPIQQLQLRMNPFIMK